MIFMNFDEEIRKIVVEDIEREAKKELGKPYFWGASGNRNFDCSSFVQYVNGKFKVELPRVAKDQFENGNLVTKVYDEKMLKKGDRLYFKNDPKRPEIVAHTGIYLGNGKMIHASSKSGKVVVDDLKKRPDLLGKNFAGAKRDIDFKKAKQIFYEKNKKKVDELKIFGNSMMKTTNQLVSKNKTGEKIAQNNKKAKSSVSKPKPKLDLGKMVENFFKPKSKKNKEKSKSR